MEVHETFGNLKRNLETVKKVNKDNYFMILVNLEEIFRLSPKHCHCFVFFQLYRIGLRLEEISEQLDNRLGQVSPRKEAGGATSRWVGVDTTGVCDGLYR